MELLKRLVGHRSPFPSRKLFRLATRGMKIIAAGDIDDIICFLFEAKPFSPELVIQAAYQGFFPFSTEKSAHWNSPPVRGIIPIDDFHIPKDIRRLIRQKRFRVTADQDFPGVMQGCAEAQHKTGESWVRPHMVNIYTELHHMGVAHSVEVWQEDKLVGGGFGVALGAYFMGESQFYRVTNAGKVAMAYLCNILKLNGYLLHDAQINSSYLEQFGAISIPREEFLTRLARATVKPATFTFREFPEENEPAPPQKANKGAKPSSGSPQVHSAEAT